MTRTILIAIALLAAAPAFAQGYPRAICDDACKARGGQYDPPQAEMAKPQPGVTCYDPGIVTGCRAHWIGSRGGGHGSAENCHALPDCPEPR